MGFSREVIKARCRIWLVFCGCCETNYHKLSGLNQQTLILAPRTGFVEDDFSKDLRVCVCVCVCARACMHMHTGGWFGDDSSALQLLCTLFLLLLQLLFRPSGTRSWQLESPDLNNRSLSCSLGGYTFNIKAVAGPRSL